MGFQREFSESDLALLEAKARIEARRDIWAYRQFLDPEMLVSWWQRDVARHLMEFWRAMQTGERPVMLITAPPQHGKSRQIVEFISWVAGQNPDLRTIYASFSDDLGVRANRDLQRIFDNGRYSGAFPGTALNGSNTVTVANRALRNSTILQYVGREGMFMNTTVQGPITGQGMDLGVLDDPIKGRAEANSITVRNRAWDWLNDDFMTRLSKNAGVLGIMTRWHVDDPFGRLMERNQNIKVLKYPAIAEKDEQFRKAGEPLFPEHKPLGLIEERRRNMTQASFEALYQQNPIIPDGGMFKRSDFGIVPAAPAGCKWVRGWDLAATDSADAAWTAGVLLGKAPDGRFYIKHVARIQGSAASVERLLANTAAQDGKEVKGSIPQDPGQAGKAQVQYLIRQLAGYNYRSSPESGDKETRAMPLAAQVEVGNVSLVRGEWNAVFLDEAETFPNGKWKDQIDAATRAFSEFSSKPKPAVFGTYG